MSRPKWEGKLRVGTRRGNALRAAVHLRDGFTCQACGWAPDVIPDDYDGTCAVGSWRLPAARELHIDHIVPRARGGNATLENLQTLCAPCNVRKSARVHV